MAKKIILRVILPLIVFMMASYSVFWFFKSGEIKKNIEQILRSDSRSSVGSVSSSGFPLSHKIEINDVELQINSKLSQDKLVIKRIEAGADIFSNDFTAQVIGDIEIVSKNGGDKVIKFNSPPALFFSVEGRKISNISYIDDGYKLLNKDGDTVFYVGDSRFSIDNSLQGALKTTKIKASFSNLSSFDIFSSGEVIEVSKDDALQPEEAEVEDEVKGEAKQEGDLPVKLPSADVSSPNDTKDENSKIKTNRDLKMDLKLVFKEDSKGVLRIDDIFIANVELFSPLYKFEVTGSVKTLGANQSTNVALNVKNIDNILIYIRKFISSLVPINLEDAQSANIEQVSELSSLEGGEASVGDVKDVEEVPIPVVDLEIREIPEEVITKLIVDLASKNANTNAQTSEFRVTGKGFDFQINDVPVASLVEKLLPMMAFLAEAFAENIADSPAGVVENDVNNDLLGEPQNAEDGLDLQPVPGSAPSVLDDSSVAPPIDDGSDLELELLDEPLDAVPATPEAKLPTKLPAAPPVVEPVAPAVKLPTKLPVAPVDTTTTAPNPDQIVSPVAPELPEDGVPLLPKTGSETQ